MAAPDPARVNTTKNGKKRSAPEVAEAPDPKKSRFPWLFRGSKSPGKGTSAAADLEMAATTGLPKSAIQNSSEWQAMSTANRIDAIMAEHREKEAEAQLRCPERKKKLDLQLDIKPDDPEWKKWHTLFQKQVLEGTVQGILDEHFEEGQKLAFLPPPTHGIILDIQNEHTEEFKALLKGQLKGQKSNIITKFTMLHFGLPVEPLTLNNILNAGKDGNDEDDVPEDLPRVQRIMFAEKPLEFLDLYHERSCGFPILRRPKPRVQQAEPLVIDPAEVGTSSMTLGLLGNPPSKPIFPSNTSVSMRGGAGKGTSVIVYGLNGFGLEIEDDRENSATPFLEATLKLLGMSNITTTYDFVVDQYRNQESHKNVPEKEHVKSFPVNQSNFAHIYDQYLKSRLFNRQRDWPMVVRRTTDEMAPTFSIPKKHKMPPTPTATTLPSKSPKKSPVKPGVKPGAGLTPPTTTTVKDPPITTKLPILTPPDSLPSKSPPKTSTSPNKTQPNPSPGQRVVYSLDKKKWQLFTDDHQSFFEASCRITDQKLYNIAFSVSQYSTEPVRQAPPGQAAYVGTTRWPSGGNGNFYTKFVADVMFKEDNPDYYKDWIIVAHPVQPNVPKFWPSGSSSEMVGVEGYQPPTNQGGTPQGQKTSPTKPDPTAATVTRGYIHGYAGIIHAENTAAGFQKAGLRLLGLDPTSAWSFYFCMRTRGGFNPSETVKVDSRNFSKTFQRQIRPRIRRAGDWEIFVSLRNINSLPAHMEPDSSRRNVVRIRHNHDTTYWKIPFDTETDYGINQLQDDFFRAMSVLFPPTEAPPPWNIHIGTATSVDIGFGGMEVTHKLWNRVASDLKSPNQGGLVYTVELVDQGNVSGLENSSQRLGIRMAGHTNYASALPMDYATIQNEILDLSNKLLKNREHPTYFKLWKTAGARARDNDDDSKVIPYAPAKESTRLIKRFLEDTPGTTNCIWFRPEWPAISIRDITNGNGIGATTAQWNVDVDTGFDGFKSALGEAVREPDLDKIKNIEMVDPDGQFRFIFSHDTPESQWRKHIYDWFSGARIMVRRDQEIVYQVEKMPPWGVPEPADGSTTDVTTSKTPQVSHSQTTNLPPKTTAPTTTKPPTPQATIPTSQLPRPACKPTVLRIPREHYKRSLVARPAPAEYYSWQKEQNRKDALQRASYCKDQSVIEPGQAPEIPLYGDCKELSLSVGPNMPEVFLQGLTQTDHATKANQVQALQNHVLERMTKCAICDAAFPEYEPEKIKEHIQAHRNAELAVGVCPLCACPWVTWDQEQRKQHLWHHQEEDETEKMETFWQGFQCPVCDEEFDPLRTDEILYHMAEHPPGLLKFCDRCSLDLSSCLPAELDHHKKFCVETECDKKRLYCDGCGKDRSNEDDKERQEHNKVCSQVGDHCKVCGIDRSQLQGRGAQLHETHCAAPGGPRKRFCQRCRLNLNTMDCLERTSHKQECYLREPRPNEKERIEELERRIAQSKALNAKNFAESARLAMLRDELDQREDEIADKEDKDGAKDNEIRQLKSAANVSVGPCPFSKAGKCNENISQLCRKDLVAHFEKHVKTGVSPQVSSSSFNCPLLLPSGGLCDKSIDITPCGTALKAHFQHNCQPCTVQPTTIQQSITTLQPGSSAVLEELARRLPEYEDFSKKMKAAADKARFDNARECPGATSNGSGTVVEDPIIAPPKPEKRNKSPPKPTKPPTRPLPKPDGDKNADPVTEGGTETDQPTTTGFARKRKTTASPRKVSAKIPAGSKRKKAVIDDDDEEDGSGEHPGFLFLKTPRTGKRQRVMREESFGMASSAGGDDSGDGDMMDRETSARPVGVRRATRATSGTPGPSVGLAPAPVARKVGRPRGRPAAGEDDLEEEAEEEEEVVRSPAKRGRQSPAKKGAK